jgi:UDPglucose 6-dehydrogenase
MRGASSLVLAARLQAEGAQVRAYDPVAEQEARKLMPDLEYAFSVEDVLQDADAAILVTEWPQFLQLDWRDVAARMLGDLVIDGRNALDGRAVEQAGLTYEGMGRRPCRR